MATKSTSKSSPVDSKLVRDLAKILKDTDLTEIEVEKADLKIRVARQITAAPVAQIAAPAPAAAPAAPAAAGGELAAPAEPAKSDPSMHPGCQKSPMVGTAYLKPNPDSAPFAKVGDQVSEGDTVLLIEAMKTFNPITAEKSGKIIELLISDGQPVEYGEPLFIVE